MVTNEMNNKKLAVVLAAVHAGLVYNGKIHILRSELTSHYLQIFAKNGPQN
jgi:hypothetical protein